LTLEFLGISKTFLDRTPGENVQVLEKIQHRVENGRFVSIIGPSSCGKTTFLRTIAGLEKASAGTVLLHGRELVQGSEDVGMVFQEYALFPWRTTLQKIEVGPEIKWVDKEERRSTATDYIKIFDLSGSKTATLENSPEA
jgi:NitT/TauT family transport system ATP-binding protein